MTDRRRPDVMSSLPSTRPQRRSAKRTVASGAATKEAGAARKPAAKRKPAAAKTAATKEETAAARLATTKEPATPKKPAARPPVTTSPPAPRPEPTPGVLGTAVQAGVELGMIGLRVGIRSVRGVLARLPRP